ncbi:MAG: amidohydrolase [Candidatus Vogelbacteria bacterium]|nr:amidohydrolase [Candidatus Vogelbacteria bacterium]
MNFKKIDIHCHTTNRVLRGMCQGTATLNDISALMKEYKVEKTVLLATYFPHRRSGITNFRLYNWIKDRPEFLLFGSLDFQVYFYQGLNELEELAEMGVLRGIKIYTVYQDVGEKDLEIVARLAAKYKIPMIFHAGYSHALDKPESLLTKASDIAWVSEIVPVIVSHMAKPALENLIATIKTHKNLYTDMSGLVNSASEQEDIPSAVEMVKRFLKECGPDKLLFGTDFPVQSHADSVRIIEEAMVGYSDEDKAKVYYGNAAKLLGM